MAEEKRRSGRKKHFQKKRAHAEPEHKPKEGVQQRGSGGGPDMGRKAKKNSICTGAEFFDPNKHLGKRRKESGGYT